MDRFPEGVQDIISGYALGPVQDKNSDEKMEPPLYMRYGVFELCSKKDGSNYLTISPFKGGGITILHRQKMRAYEKLSYQEANEIMNLWIADL